MSAREKELCAAMKQQGYRAEVTETGRVILHVLPIGRWASGYELPYGFRSIHQAAEHLVPIVRDDAYWQVVCGGAS